MSERPPESTSPSGDGPNLSELVGTVLAGRYRIERRLGSGGMGAVYLGEHLRMGRRDAIKVMRAEMAHDHEAIARFTRGARAVARIHHPNVCQVYDFGEAEGGILFLAMEYIEGPSLSKLLAEEGRLKPDRAIRFIQQAGEALHAAHQSGIIHRDLKPDNLMVAQARDGSEQLKVVDFDIARGTEEEGAGVTRQGFVVGTPEYMSPEQLTGDPLDARSDVYSLALVLFRCLTGRLAFEGTTAQELMMQRLSVAPLRLSQAAPGRTFPPGLEDALHAALSKLPDERPESAREFVRQVVASTERAAPPPPLDEATRVAPAAAGWSPTGASDATRVAPGTAVGTGRPPSPGAIPGTQVSSGAGGGAGSVTVAPNRRRLLLGGGATGLLAASVAGWLLLNSGQDPDPGVGLGEAGDSVPAVALDPSDDPDLMQSSPAGSGVDGGEGPARSQEAGRSQDTNGSAATEDPTPDTGPGDPPPVSEGNTQGSGLPAPVAGARPVTLAAGDARGLQQITFAQYRLQAEGTSPAAFRAARDTAAAVWAVPTATGTDRAFAAHVIGLSLIALGDTVQAVEWLAEAVRLDPLERYVGPLEAYRRPGR